MAWVSYPYIRTVHVQDVAEGDLMAEARITGEEREGAHRTWRAAKPIAVGIASAACLFAFPPLGSASHSDQGGGPRDFAVGSGSNQFLIAVGDARLSVAAHSDASGGDPTGHVRAKGDPDGAGPMEPFKLEGEVTCVEVRGNRAAIKYRFKHAEGSAEPFEGGGVQIFVEDNGKPSGGEAVDRTTFDPPQTSGVFDLNASQCDDPDSRLGYDQIESGNFTVHDAAP
jgi:hypothetical protein